MRHFIASFSFGPLVNEPLFTKASIDRLRCAVVDDRGCGKNRKTDLSASPLFAWQSMTFDSPPTGSLTTSANLLVSATAVVLGSKAAASNGPAEGLTAAGLDCS